MSINVNFNFRKFLLYDVNFLMMGQGTNFKFISHPIGMSLLWTNFGITKTIIEKHNDGCFTDNLVTVLLYIVSMNLPMLHLKYN